MITTKLLNTYLESDELFNTIFPKEILGNLINHLTPVDVAKSAVKFLTQDGENNIVDIGSGPGKFCLIGACLTEATFTGVERRKELTEIAISLAVKFNITNIKFIDDNIFNYDFSSHEGFYLFNPFYENLEAFARMDDQFTYSYKMFQKYTEHVKQILAEAALGTKVAAFHGYHNEIPNSFKYTTHPEFEELKLFTKKFRGG